MKPQSSHRAFKLNSTMFSNRHKATQTQRVTFADEGHVPNTVHPSHPKGSHGSNGHSGDVRNNPTAVSTEKKHPKGDNVYVQSVDKMPRAKTEGTHFPNLQLMFNEKPVYGNPGDIMHDVPVVKEKKKKNGGAGEKEKTVGEEGDKYQDVDVFAVEFLKKKHEFFERQRLLSMQMRA